MGWNASTAATVAWSMISSIEGVATVMACSTARPADVRSANTATTVVGGGGSGRRRSSAWVTTARVPSLPTTRPVRS